MHILSFKSSVLSIIMSALFFSNSFGKLSLERLTWHNILIHGGKWEELDILPWKQVKKDTWEQNLPRAEAVFKKLFVLYIIRYQQMETEEEKNNIENLACYFCTQLCNAFGDSCTLHPKLQNRFVGEILNVKFDLNGKKLPLPESGN